MTDDDQLFFADEEPAEGSAATRKSRTAEAKPWKIMIVDDEPAMHDVTRLALSGVTFGGRSLEFISCYSGAEAIEAMAAHPDTALMLLDVVMETEHAGLEVARRVREELRNELVRIVLRTGQPGQAPERKVITDYDINDYKEKTELTSSKLFTLLYASLRAYQSILSIELSKRGLEKVIEASADIFKLSSLDRFAHGVLEQLSALLQISPGALFMQQRQEGHINGLAACFAGNRWHAIAGVGKYAQLPTDNLADVLGKERMELLDRAATSEIALDDSADFAVSFEDRFGNRNLLLIEGIEPLGPLERDLARLFLRNVSIAFENVHLHADIDETQREIIFLLGEAVEARSQETGNHVRRVAKISALLADGIGLSEKEADIVRQASPLHDLGKIAIPDAILNKPGILTDDERATMLRHAEIGYQMLKGSPREVLQAAAQIAHGHHERWDGTGYPNRLSGEDIHIYGRITAVADVFDALLSDRCYKQAWPVEKVVAFFKEERGRQFDPALVDLLLSRLDEVMAIRARLPDSAKAKALESAGAN